MSPSDASSIFVVGLGFLALKYPVAAAIVVIICAVLMVTFAAWIIRAVRRRWSRPDATQSSGVAP